MARSKTPQTPDSAFARPIPSSGGTGPLDALPVPTSVSGVSLGNLWQMPLLIVSLGLFALAAYLFIDPQPAPTLQHQIALARRDIDAARHAAAIGRLGDLLQIGGEERDLAPARIMLAEALDEQIQRDRRNETRPAHRRIISQTEAALAAGLAPTPVVFDRAARSHEALGEIDDAAAGFGRATEMHDAAGHPERGVPMRRAAVEMLVAADRVTQATEALGKLLEVPGLADDEKAWALGELARLSIDGNRPAEATSLLKAALALSPDDAIRGQVNFRLGYAAHKLGEGAEAERYLTLAREQLGPGHSLESEALYLLGRLAQDREGGGGGRGVVPAGGGDRPRRAGRAAGAARCRDLPRVAGRRRGRRGRVVGVGR